MRVTVIGVSGAVGLSGHARDALQAAELVIGSGANLCMADAPTNVERIELGPLAPAMARLAELAELTDDRRAVVLASGDPGLFGILRALRSAGHECEVVPSVSSIAACYALAGLPWDDAVLVSAHGREFGPAVNACRAFGNVAVLTAPGAGPVELAQALDGWPRELVIAEHLGLAGQRLTRSSAAEIAQRDAAEFADPNVVICLDPERTAPAGHSTARQHNQPSAAPAEGWALPESVFAHRDSMITKSEVRAVAVAKLRPGLGRLVLDIGAGSGSVGIECNRLGAAVIAIERDADASRLIASNAAAHDARVRIVEGSAPEALGGLPAADSAFIGGGGTDVVKAVAELAIPVVVAAFAALDRAVAARELLRAAGYQVEGVQLSAARLSDLPGGSVRLAATNPVLILTGELR